MNHFTVNKLNQTGMSRAKSIQKHFEILLEALESPVLYHEEDDNRCRAIVRTKLEEACFYAKKAMALNPVNQEESGG